MKTIEQTRRELFEAWAERTYNWRYQELDNPTLSTWTGDEYGNRIVQGMFCAFNAALDAVAIKIPLPVNRAFHEYDMGYNEALDHCESAIESSTSA